MLTIEQDLYSIFNKNEWFSPIYLQDYVIKKNDQRPENVTALLVRMFTIFYAL